MWDCVRAFPAWRSTFITDHARRNLNCEHDCFHDHKIRIKSFYAQDFLYSENIHKSNDSLHTKIFKFLPWFVIGFLSLCLLRSINIIDQSLGQDIRSIAKYLFIISMIAIGLSVDIKKIIDVGPRVAITIISIISFMIFIGLISSKFI